MLSARRETSTHVITAPFEASRRVGFFDYFRVPYRVMAEPVDEDLLNEGVSISHPDDSPGRVLAWLRVPHDAPTTAPGVVRGAYRLGSIPLYAHLLPDAQVKRHLAASRRRWSASAPIHDSRGRQVASLWRAEDGSLFLPFDPDEVIRNFVSEAYLGFGGSRVARVYGPAKRFYYRVRPVVPRWSQIWMRRAFSRLQARSRFPRWPVETALHDFYDWLFRSLAALWESPIPWLSPWPDGRSWALVLTHDVESEVGYQNLHRLRDIEVETGFRSSWNFVPMRYAVEDALVRELSATGFEVGVHGLYHDGRDLESIEILSRRAPLMREYGERWSAVGFRSPATNRVWEWMPRLGFDYDSSYSDTAPFEPQAGGCCSWLPYWNRDQIELPITLAQDHTLFVILRQPDEAAWLEKARFLRSRGGMALLITHPDYLLEADQLDVYRRFLESFRDDPTAWKALPREVASWWRRRASSRLEPTDQGWRIVGPAADEGRVLFADTCGLGAGQGATR